MTCDSIKGAGDIPDGVNSVMMLGEEKGSRRVKNIVNGAEVSRVEWVSYGVVLKVAKAKDAEVEFPVLHLTFNRKKLRYVGQIWRVKKDGVVVETEMGV